MESDREECPPLPGHGQTREWSLELCLGFPLWVAGIQNLSHHPLPPSNATEAKTDVWSVWNSKQHTDVQA